MEKKVPYYKVPYCGNQDLDDVIQPSADDEGEYLFESDAWSDNGDEDTGMGSPTGEDI